MWVAVQYFDMVALTFPDQALHIGMSGLDPLLEMVPCRKGYLAGCQRLGECTRAEFALVELLEMASQHRDEYWVLWGSSRPLHTLVVLGFQQTAGTVAMGPLQTLEIGVLLDPSN